MVQKCRVESMKLLLLLLLATAPVVVRAQYTFTTNNDTLAITGYTGQAGEVEIPGATNGYAITSIEAGFSAMLGLTSVILPDSITNIGENVFVNCQYLANISVAAANPAFSSSDGALFDKAGETLFRYPIGLTNRNYTI